MQHRELLKNVEEPVHSDPSISDKFYSVSSPIYA